jgi:WD40 repeat protein
LEIWNWRDGSRKLFKHLNAEIHSIFFRRGGQYIAVTVDDGDVLIWNIRTGQLVEKLMGHRAWVGFTPFLKSPLSPKKKKRKPF